MEPTRIREQYKAALQYPDALIGSGFRRIPSDSTPILTKWGNSLTERQLYAQIYTSFGPTLAMPTWFCGRSVYLRVRGGFDERGKGIPEDLIFFYQHLDGGGTLFRVPEPLLLYRFHAGATTHSVSEYVNSQRCKYANICKWMNEWMLLCSATICQLRLKRLEEKVLSGWSSFTIWNAGKAGRKLFRSLSPESRDKVTAFCDVDEKKLELGFYSPHPLPYKIPIKHPSKGTKPFIIAVKIVSSFELQGVVCLVFKGIHFLNWKELSWDETGAFRQILDSLSLTEGEDYFYFNWFFYKFFTNWKIH